MDLCNKFNNWFLVPFCSCVFWNEISHSQPYKKQHFSVLVAAAGSSLQRGLRGRVAEHVVTGRSWFRGVAGTARFRGASGSFAAKVTRWGLVVVLLWGRIFQQVGSWWNGAKYAGKVMLQQRLKRWWRIDKSDKTSENLRQILGGFTLSVLRSARKFTVLRRQPHC